MRLGRTMPSSVVLGVLGYVSDADTVEDEGVEQEGDADHEARPEADASDHRSQATTLVWGTEEEQDVAAKWLLFADDVRETEKRESDGGKENVSPQSEPQSSPSDNASVADRVTS